MGSSAANLIDHYKQVKARMGMAPATPVVRPRIVEKTVIVYVPQKPVTPPRVVRRPKPLYEGQRLTSIHIQFVVADFYGITRDELVSTSRKANILRARQVAIYLSRKLTRCSLPQIGAQFHRDHATVINSQVRIEGLVESSEELAGQVMELQFILTGKYPSTYFGA